MTDDLLYNLKASRTRKRSEFHDRSVYQVYELLVAVGATQDQWLEILQTDGTRWNSRNDKFYQLLDLRALLLDGSLMMLNTKLTQGNLAMSKEFPHPIT